VRRLWIAEALDKRISLILNAIWNKLALVLPAALVCCLAHCGAAIPAPEKLLPEDTLVLVTAPDWARFKEVCLRAPEIRLWQDEAMRPFRSKLVSKCKEELVEPLERELKLSLGSLASLPQGQLTFALTQNGWQGKAGQAPGWLLLVDAREHSGQLTTNLAAFRKHWVEAGKSIRTEKIRDLEFSVLLLSSNDVPKGLAKFLPRRLAYQEVGAENEPKPTPARSELVIGQADSLLVAGNSTKAVEKVVIRLAGGALPVLGDQAAYSADHRAFFREAPAYAWVNAKALLDLLCRQWAEKKENPEAPSPVEEPPPDKLVAAYGLTGLKTVALGLEISNEGLLFRAFLGVPEAARQGLLKILTGEAKESSPPPFVPANTVKFQRWRLDGSKAWTTFEKILADLSPEAPNGLKLIFETAGAKARETEPGYDLKGALLSNLGDDLITCQKAPRGLTPGEVGPGPSLCLLGSANPEQLAAALKALFVIFPGGDSATEREFLGRRVFSVPLPATLPVPLPEGARPPGPATLHYAASRDYVALSTEASLLEEYLRSSQNQGRSLRETPGLPEAAQKVTGPGTDMFGYENRVEIMRGAFEAFKKDSASSTNGSGPSPWPALPGMTAPQQSLREWVDFSLLPPFDKVAKYFHFLVYGGSASVDGLTFTLFAPMPPALGH
jgi:hypothetical protein